MTRLDHIYLAIYNSEGHFNFWFHFETFIYFISSFNYLNYYFETFIFIYHLFLDNKENKEFILKLKKKKNLLNFYLINRLGYTLKTNNSVKLLNVLKAMPHRYGPDEFFSLPGRKPSVILTILTNNEVE